MNNCLTCKYWLRSEDPVIGTCQLAPDNAPFTFQFESCLLYEEGEAREPYKERGFARRIYNDEKILATTESEKEAEIVELLKQGVTVKEIRQRYHVTTVYMAALTRNHRAEYKAGKEIYRKSKPDPLDAYASEFKRMLDNGASYYKIQTVTGINRQRVSEYMKRRGWSVAG